MSPLLKLVLVLIRHQTSGIVVSSVPVPQMWTNGGICQDKTVKVILDHCTMWSHHRRHFKVKGRGEDLSLIQQMTTSAEISCDRWPGLVADKKRKKKQALIFLHEICVIFWVQSNWFFRPVVISAAAEVISAHTLRASGKANQPRISK